VGYIPTPAERQKKEEEKKIQAEKEKKEKQQKAEAEAAAAAAKPKPEKMSREQWDLQNKKNKLAQLNAASNPPAPPQPGQDNKANAGFQPARPPKQQYQQYQPLTQSSQPGQQQQQQQQGEYRGGRRGGGRGRGGGRYAEVGTTEGGQNQAAGRGGAGGEGGGRRGGRGGEGGRRGGGRGRRGGGRGGANLDEAQRFEENKNRDVNQRGEDLTNPPPPRKRQYGDRKSGGHVTNYGNKNVGNFTNIEEQNADWANTAAPPEAEKETTVGWGEENATEQIGSFDDVDKATTDAAPVAAPEKEKEKEKDKEEELPTKGLEEFLAEQNKRIEALAALLAQRNKETPSKAPGPRTIAQDESGGRYVEVHRLTNQLPKKPKPEKPAAEVAEPKAKKPATGEPETKKPLARPDIVFNVKKQFGRRYGKEDYIVFEEKEKQAKKNFKDYKKENKDKDSTAAKEGGEQQQTGEENTPAKEKK